MPLLLIEIAFRIPLERGRDIALQYGVAPLLAPLFDFVPNAGTMGGLPSGLPNMTGANSLLPYLPHSHFQAWEIQPIWLLQVLLPHQLCQVLLSAFLTKDVLKVSSLLPHL